LISYAVDGKQYIAITVGHGSAHALTFPMLTPEIDLPIVRSATIARRRQRASRLRRALALRPQRSLGREVDGLDAAVAPVAVQRRANRPAHAGR
jgi:hypothetical protein